MAVKSFFSSRKGFSYMEIMAGMAVFLIAATFIVNMYRFSSSNRVSAKELTAMATVAQNMAEVYKATSGTIGDAVDAAMWEGQSEGFTAEDLERPVPVRMSSDPANFGYRVLKVTITVHPRVSASSIDDYVFVFYTLDKNYLS